MKRLNILIFLAQHSIDTLQIDQIIFHMLPAKREKYV
jgi:hypothetical protein